MTDTNKNKSKTQPPKGNPQPGKPDNSSKKNNKFNSYLIPAIIGLSMLLMFFLSSQGEVKEVEWRTVRDDYIQNREIEKLVIVNQSIVEVYIKADKIDQPKHSGISKKGLSSMSTKTGPHYQFKIASVDRFTDILDEAQKNLEYNERIEPEAEYRRDVFNDLLGWLLPLAILVVIWLFIFRRMSSGAGLSLIHI